MLTIVHIFEITKKFKTLIRPPELPEICFSAAKELTHRIYIFHTFTHKQFHDILRQTSAITAVQAVNNLLVFA